MREIKFRAWDKESKEMFNIFDGSHDNWFLPSWKDKYNVMQYTGLKDADDKEVYEGDLIKDANGEMFEMKFGEYTRTIPIRGFQRMKLSGYGWYIEKIETKEIVLATECQYVEVVGNIYENKEILEVGYEG